MYKRILALLLTVLLLLGFCAWSAKGWHLEAEKDKFGDETGYQTVVCGFSGTDSRERKFSGTVSFNAESWAIRIRDEEDVPLNFAPQNVGSYRISLKIGKRVIEESSRDAVEYGDEIRFDIDAQNLVEMTRALLRGENVTVLLEGEYSPSYTFKLEGEGFAEQWFARATALYEKKEYVRAENEFYILAVFAYPGAAEQVQACEDGIHSPDYEAAKKLFEEGRFEEAKAAFERLGDYRDSAAQAENCQEAMNDRDYKAAEALLEAGKFEEAKAAFRALGSYKDSADMVKECDYRKAKALYAKGDYNGAYAAFALIKGYKDADTLLATDEYLLTAVWPGKIVTFGTWGGEPIEWQVLEVKEDGSCLLLSVKGLDARPYNTEYRAVTWETCTLRAWLNGEFYEKPFSASEKKQIVLSTVENPDNKTYGTGGGNTTRDRVYLLSIDEAKRYFASDSARVCYPTAYAKKNGAFANSAGACWWWLRSPGYDHFLLGQCLLRRLCQQRRLRRQQHGWVCAARCLRSALKT